MISFAAKDFANHAAVLMLMYFSRLPGHHWSFHLFQYYQQTLIAGLLSVDLDLAGRLYN